MSWLDPHKVRRLTVVGSRQMAVFDDVAPANKLMLFDKTIALVNGAGATVKRYYREPGGWIRLQPANDQMAPLYVDPNNVEIQGKVIAVGPGRVGLGGSARPGVIAGGSDKEIRSPTRGGAEQHGPTYGQQTDERRRSKRNACSHRGFPPEKGR